MRIIDSIYDALGDEQIYSHLPELLSEALGARSCVLQLFGQDRSLKFINFSYFTDEMNTYYAQTKMYENDIWSGVLSNPLLYGKPIALENHVSRRTFDTSIFCNDFFRRFGDDTGHCLGFGMRNGDGDLITVGFHRALRDHPFSERSVQRLSEIIPHLGRLFLVRSKLEKAQQQAKIATSALDAIGHGIILSDRFGRPLLMNRTAEALISKRDGLLLANGHLLASVPAIQGKLSRSLMEAVNRTGDVSASLAIERPSGARAYRLTIAPWAVGDNSCALLLIDDPSSGARDSPPLLMGLYGMTQAEAQISLMLAEGLSAEEIAEKRGVGLPTIRSQIQTALRKTNARRSSELVGLVARLPRPAEPK